MNIPPGNPERVDKFTEYLNYLQEQINLNWWKDYLRPMPEFNQSVNQNVNSFINEKPEPLLTEGEHKELLKRLDKLRLDKSGFKREKKKIRKSRYETISGWKKRAIKYRTLYKIQFARYKKLYARHIKSVNHKVEFQNWLWKNHPDVLREWVSYYSAKCKEEGNQ